MINVLIVSHSLIPSVLLCGHSQLEYLKNNNEIDYKFVRASKVSNKVLSWADIIVFLRSESELEVYTSNICKSANKHMIYVLDDDLLNTPDYLSSSVYYNRPEVQNNIKQIMANCDTFLTSSPIMLEKYGKMFKNAFRIDEPSLNAIDNKTENEIVKIGFAGSIDRAKDINEIMSDSIELVIEKYKDKIEIEFMGAKPDFVDEYNLTYIPYTESYDNYTKTIKERNWDIGLAPMPKSEFHRCKYFNKYVEYASFGIAGLYSNVEPYTFGIKDGYNGLLVNNDTQSWFKAISRLIDDDSLRKSISTNCLKEAHTSYSLKTLASDYLDKITTNYNKSQTREKVKGITKYRIISLYNRIKYKIQEQKWNLPIWFVKKVMKKLKHEE